MYLEDFVSLFCLLLEEFGEVVAGADFLFAVMPYVAEDSLVCWGGGYPWGEFEFVGVLCFECVFEGES